MSTTCPYPCPAIALHRPWWQRWLRAAAERMASAFGADRCADARDPSTWTATDLSVLAGLPARTLRDIGAPEWVHEGRSAAERAGLDLLRL